MFKYLHKLAKRILAQGENYLLRLMLEKDCLKNELQDCAQSSGETFDEFIPPEVWKTLSTCIQDLAGRRGKITETFITGAQLDMQALVTLFTEKASANGQLRPSKQQITRYVTPRREMYLVNLSQWHFALAIADIILGDYEEFDPIIGDQGCEMRCPFLLDVIVIIQRAAQGFTGTDGVGPDYVISLAKTVQTASLPYPGDFDVTGKILKNLIAVIPLDFSLFCDACRTALDDMPSPTEEEFLGLPVMIDDKPELLIKSNGDIHYSAATYLQLCKTFTRNRDAHIDDFGVDIDFETDVKFFDWARFERRWTTGALDRFMADLNKQFLAHCSTGYLKYVARNLTDKYGTGSLFGGNYQVFNQCQSMIVSSGYMINLIPAYDALRVLLGHAGDHGHPIILNLTRLQVCAIDNSNEFEYRQIGAWVLYYEPDQTGKFHYIAHESLTPTQKKKPGLAVVAASIVNPLKPCHDFPGGNFINSLDGDEFINGFIACDISHLLMWHAYNHAVLPKGAIIPQSQNNTCSILLQNNHDFSQKQSRVKTGWGFPLSRDGSRIDDGLDYLRRCLYGSIINNLPPEDYAFQPDTMTLTQSPCPFYGDPGGDWNLAREFDYYKALTRAMGLNDGDVYYTRREGERNEDTRWLRNDCTLIFTATHVYVTTAHKEQAYARLTNLEIGATSPDIIVRSSTRKKYDIYNLLRGEPVLDEDSE